MSNYSSAYPELDTYEKLQKDVLKVRKQIGPINQRSSAALIDFMELVVDKIKVVETMPDDDYGSVSAAL